MWCYYVIVPVELPAERMRTPRHQRISVSLPPENFLPFVWTSGRDYFVMPKSLYPLFSAEFTRKEREWLLGCPLTFTNSSANIPSLPQNSFCFEVVEFCYILLCLPESTRKHLGFLLIRCPGYEKAECGLPPKKGRTLCPACFTPQIIWISRRYPYPYLFRCIFLGIENMEGGIGNPL